MTVRRPIRRRSKSSRRSCRKSCRSGRKTPASGSKTSRRHRRAEPGTARIEKARSDAGLFIWRVMSVSRAAKSVHHGVARMIAAVVVALEHFGDLRMPDRLAGVVRQKVLLRHVSDVFAFGVLGE